MKTIKNSEKHKLKYFTNKYYKGKQVEAATYYLFGIDVFSIATDIMGCQACSKGRWWPENFRSVDDGVQKLSGKEWDLIKFFVPILFTECKLFKKFFWKHQWKLVTGKFTYCANDKDFPDWPLKSTASYWLDLYLFLYGLLRYRKRFLFWHVYKDACGNLHDYCGHNHYSAEQDEDN